MRHKSGEEKEKKSVLYFPSQEKGESGDITYSLNAAAAPPALFPVL